MITFKKVPGKYFFNSRELATSGKPLYSFEYLGIEQDMFNVYYQGYLLAVIKKEEDVRDFIESNEIWRQNANRVSK